MLSPHSPHESVSMFELTVTPRFYETDAFGHVNNTVVTGWFETGR